MNGKFISGTEILNLIAIGDLNSLKNIYVIYKFNSGMGINSLATYNLGAFINDFNSPNLLFVKIEEEQ